MVFIKDPDWYLSNQNTSDKIYSNLIFLVIGLYYIYMNNLLLGFLFIFLAIGSTTFHTRTNRETLLFDRFTMVLVFSYFFHLFYPNVSMGTFALFGIMTLLIWYKTEELFYYFLFQMIGLLLFLFYYPMNMYQKLIITVMYILISYSQLLERGKYHSLKHIGLAGLALTIYR
jgi:hypothetical protein